MSTQQIFRCDACDSVFLKARGLSGHISQKSCRATLLSQIKADAERTRAAQLAAEAAGEELNMDVPVQDDFGADFDMGAPSPSSTRPTVEDVPDEDGFNPNRRFIREFPGAGAPLFDETGRLRREKTSFERMRETQVLNGLEPWAPWKDEEEWELVRWLIESGTSQTRIDKFLKLSSIQNHTKPSVHNKRSFFQKIDALPCGPEWVCDFFEIEGNLLDAKGKPRIEELELWRRDPVECIRELVGNPVFQEHMRYAPQRVFKDENGHSRIYDEMNTGEWWWNLQKLLPEGSTIVPVILSSDKTSLSRHSGDKSAWPVYLSIGCIDKGVRKQPSQHAMVLIGYIPISKLEIFTKARRSVEGWQIFHDCMRAILEPLVDAGKNGVEMVCADGLVRKVYPIVAAYIADYPEQSLITCTRNHRCPKCVVPIDELGDPTEHPLRDPKATAEALASASRGECPYEVEEEGLRPTRPFWDTLPHCNIFECMTPDLLHQLHKGVFFDHIVQWSTAAMNGTKKEVDHRFQALPRHPSLRHFTRGISLVSQWTGTEYKNMEKVFLGVLAGNASPQAIRTVRGVLDFVHYAHFESHSTESLQKLDEAWSLFHENKGVFFEAGGVRGDADIPKIHSMQHYIDAIRALGSADGYNSEGPERLHIDLAKLAYAASNKKAYIKQMTVWLRRQEAVHMFCRYLQWAIPTYEAKIAREDSDEDYIEEDGEGDEEEEDEEPEEEPIDVLYPSSSSATVAKAAPFPRTSIATLEKEYGAVSFIDALNTFLRDNAMRIVNPRSPPFFAVYKRIVITLPPIPQVSALETRDTVRTTRPQAARLGKRAAEGIFDTVLAREFPGDFDIRKPLVGLCVAQVRVIFKLPPELGQYREPLAYVEWFTPLGKVDKNLDLHRITRSSAGGKRRVLVIPISQIARSCHLLPKFAVEANRRWTSETVLDQAKTFYLNSYLRHLDFVLFHHPFL